MSCQYRAIILLVHFVQKVQEPDKFRPINKLQNGVILLIFKVWKFRNIGLRFVGNLILNTIVPPQDLSRCPSCRKPSQFNPSIRSWVRPTVCSTLPGFLIVSVMCQKQKQYFLIIDYCCHIGKIWQLK